jgi:HEAT repeat protein
MKPTTFTETLQGGDRRSIGNSNQVSAHVLRHPSQLPELIECLWSDDPIVRMRAADAAEKVSVRRPELLHPFKKELLGLADEATQAELRWHLALMLPRLSLAKPERTRARATLQRYLNDRSSIVKTWALHGMVELSKGDPELESEMLELLERASRTGTPAMKARSRKLISQFQKQLKQI